MHVQRNAAAIRPRYQSPPCRAGRRIRILVAHDEASSRDNLAKLLALEADFDVVAVARDGDQVLQLLPRARPDIVLLDLKMPGGGLTTLEKLQQRNTRPPRVIVLTSTGDESASTGAMRVGACGVVPQQIAAECLAACIRQVHSGGIWRSNRISKPIPEESAAANDDSFALSRRERQIVALVAQGLKNKEIATRLFISDQTVKNHLHEIFEKVGARDRLELVLYTIANRAAFFA